MADKKKLHLDELLAAFFLGIMAVLTFINVLNRYIFKSSFAFTEEITVSLFVWITLLGIAIAFRRGSNLKMTNLYDSLKPGMKKAVLLVSGIIGLIIFGFLIYNSVREIYKNVTFYHTTSEALGIPTWIYSMGTPVFSLFVIKELVASTFKSIKEVNSETSTTREEEQ